jgi:hypothetical protein
VQDTGTDGAKAQAEAQALVLKDHVFAVAPVASEVVLARVAIIGTDNAGAAASMALVGGGFKRDGYNVVYNKSPLPLGGATDYAP